MDSTLVHNPDVLECLANLSSDEVFTPPKVVNDMLDMLPQELFTKTTSKFLDPCCKSGIFLREIAKRLIAGTRDQYDSLQACVDHIFHKQLFGIAITELTSLMSRRSLYCSKDPSCIYSASHFESVAGNIRFKTIEHHWSKGKCRFCGASQSEYDRGNTKESHAYEFIHCAKMRDLQDELLKTEYPKSYQEKDMHFDVIIGNPPYQLDTAGAGKQAKPIYHNFIINAKKLQPRYLSMIIPSRWFAGGMGLDEFRDIMKVDKSIKTIVDYANAKDCFPQNSISGGVCYFLRDDLYSGNCEFINLTNNSIDICKRSLGDYPVIIRYNKAVSIISKIQNEVKLDSITSSLMPFGLSTNVRGSVSKDTNSLSLYSSDGVTYINRDIIEKGKDLIDCYKVLVSKTGAEHAGEPSKDGKFKVLTSGLKVLGPKEICTHSYFVIGKFDNEIYALNLYLYLKTKFVRFLILQAMSSINLSKLVFPFVPIQDFNKPWTDAELYEKYGLTQEEIDFIESMIKPME